MDSPTSAKNNLHHTVSYRSMDEFLDDLLGFGPSDPDKLDAHSGHIVPIDSVLIDLDRELPF